MHLVDFLFIGYHIQPPSPNDRSQRPPNAFGVRGSAWLGRRAGLRWFPAFLSSSSVQNIQNPLALVARATDGNRHQQHHHFPWTKHVELSSRSDHHRLRHDKAPDFLESLAERDVFTNIQSLGKSARRAVRLPSAKEET